MTAHLPANACSLPELDYEEDIAQFSKVLQLDAGVCVQGYRLGIAKEQSLQRYCANLEALAMRSAGCNSPSYQVHIACLGIMLQAYGARAISPSDVGQRCPVGNQRKLDLLQIVAASVNDETKLFGSSQR
ncbi:unnamed protein product [Effrenium voratum]|uniref:Uncharacterized protein n=1 Tax=Effrenium voratum TaxID=2562239 RepID=A0AA36J4Q0_9DINO|nr:unnamed protein product [Effrenium voratum]CAJ1458629.1 unnamed protein product [Effrenium voratum]